MLGFWKDTGSWCVLWGSGRDAVPLQEGLVWIQCPTCINGGNLSVPAGFPMGGPGGEDGRLEIKELVYKTKKNGVMTNSTKQ